MQLSNIANEPRKGLAGQLTPHAQYWYLQVGLAGIGGVLLIAGFRLDLPLVIDAGTLTLAAAAVASGLASMLTRRIVFLWPSQRYHLVAWHGSAAALAGLGFLVLGLAACLAVFAHLGGLSLNQICDALIDRPWRALIPIGFFMLANILAIIIGFEERRDPLRGPLWSLPMSIPNRLGGLVGSTIGAVVLAIGSYELLWPQAFDVSSNGFPTAGLGSLLGSKSCQCHLPPFPNFQLSLL